MKTKNFKKPIALFLAVMLCASLLFSLGTTAFAAEETANVCLIAFPRDGDANYSGEWGHGNLNFMNGWSTKASAFTLIRAMGQYSGNICYCIEPGVSQQPGDSLTKKGEDFWDNYPAAYNKTISPEDIKLLIGRIFQYGYTGPISVSWRSQNDGGDKLAHAVATQLLIWETVVGERDADFNKIGTNGKDAIVDQISTNHPLYGQIMGYYSSIAANVQYHSSIPSFLAKTAAEAQSASLEWDGEAYDKIHKELFYAVYQKSLYVITDENLSLIQKEILNEKNEDTLLHKNYSLLCLHSESALTKYVNHNINEYFDVMLKMSSGIICDDENVAVVVLNNSDLTTEHKQAYIHSLETKITSIKAIKDSSLWAALLDANIVQYSECNIMDCFNAVKLNSSVVSYINQCDIDLDFSKTEYDENTKGALFDSVITCSDIGNSKYAQILSSLNFVYDDFDISGISNDKIAILIDKKIIRMTTDNLSFIRNNYPDQKFHFIHINMKEYVDTVGKTLFSQNELVEILTWDINDDLKISLLKMSKEPISIIGKGYSTAVCLHILSNNFAESDLPSLFSSFEQWDDSIQEKIFDHAVNNISCIIDNQDSIPAKLIKSLLNSESVSRDEKLDLFAAIMPGLCVDDIQSILILLNLTDYLKIFDMRSRPKFEINNESEKLLAAFKECHLIDSYEESTTKAGYYKVARPKATKALSKEPSTVT